MADAVAKNTIFLGSRRAVYVFTNVSDGTGESGVLKVDISTLTGTPTKVGITRIQWACNGMDVRVLFDHTTDDTALVLSGQGSFDFRDYPYKDPGSAGDTGDILFTTIGHTANDTYTIVLEIQFQGD